MGMEMKSCEWERMGTVNVIPAHLYVLWSCEYIVTMR